jgi:drug/metabolite transporter (DMT)-like permease
MTSAMQMLAGGAMMLVTGSLLGEWPRLLQQEISTKSLLAFTYLTLVGGLIGYTTYAWLLRNASPNAISTYAYVNPLVAVLLGWLLGGETLGLHVWVAAVLVIGAVVLITLPKSSSSKSESRSNMTVCNAGQARGLSYERSAIRCDE